MKTKSDKKYISLIFLVLSIIPIVIIGKCTTLYGDDFIYATYFSDGLKNFLDMTYLHYINMNGRALVHFLLEVILIFKDNLFFIVIPLLLISVFILYHKASANGKINLLDFMTICCLCTISLSPNIIREGLLWMAGAMNYIFPLCLTFAALLIQKKAINNNKINLIIVLAMFVCGATTEQGGAMTFSVAALYVIRTMLNKKNLSPMVICLPLFALLGYLTVILSPSTSARTVAETADAAIPFIKRLDNLYYIAIGKGGALWLFELTLLLFALRFKDEHKSVTFAAVITVISSLLLSLWGLTTFAGILLTLTYLYICFFLFSKNKHIEKAIILSAALMSVGMLLFSTTFGYRNIMPCILSLICLLAEMFLEYLSKHTFTKYVSFGLAFIIAAISSFHLVSGYIDNRRIIDNNLSCISNSEDGFYYNTDINPLYGYNQFISDNYYRLAFKKIYDVDSDTKIFLRGKDFTDLRINNIHLEYPMYTENSIEYFPMRSIIEAYGGNLSFDENTKQTIIDINNKKVYYNNSTKQFSANGNIIDASDRCANNKKYGRFFEFNQYFTRDIFEIVFSISL